MRWSSHLGGSGGTRRLQGLSPPLPRLLRDATGWHSWWLSTSSPMSRDVRRLRVRSSKVPKERSLKRWEGPELQEARGRGGRTDEYGWMNYIAKWGSSNGSWTYRCGGLQSNVAVREGFDESKHRWSNQSPSGSAKYQCNRRRLASGGFTRTTRASNGKRKTQWRGAPSRAPWIY